MYRTAHTRSFMSKERIAVCMDEDEQYQDDDELEDDELEAGGFHREDEEGLGNDEERL